MNLGDIISLAKAGYKKKDIDELIKIPVDEQEEPEAPESTEEEPSPEGGDEGSPEEPEDVPDFEKLYNDTKKELENVKKKLKQAQKANTKKDLSDKDPEPDDLSDIFRSFM